MAPLANASHKFPCTAAYTDIPNTTYHEVRAQIGDLGERMRTACIASYAGLHECLGLIIDIVDDPTAFPDIDVFDALS